MLIPVGRAIQSSGDRAEAVTTTSRGTGSARGRPMEGGAKALQAVRTWGGRHRCGRYGGQRLSLPGQRSEEQVL